MQGACYIYDILWYIFYNITYVNNNEKVGDKLKDIKDIKVFLDRDSMTGDTKKTMAMGIKMTKVVLVFITQGYIDRVEAAWENNCKYEWEAACNLNKRLYPVVMDPKLRNPSSWGALLSAKLGGVIYADFATDENIDICVETILKETHKWRL